MNTLKNLGDLKCYQEGQSKVIHKVYNDNRHINKLKYASIAYFIQHFYIYYLSIISDLKTTLQSINIYAQCKMQHISEMKEFEYKGYVTRFMIEIRYILEISID